MSTAAGRIPRRIFPWSAAWAISLIVLGLLGIVLPLETSLGVVLIIGALLVISGATRVIFSFHATGFGRIVWKVLVGVLYLGVGGYFLTHPLAGLRTLTLVVGCFFLIEAIMDLATYFGYFREGTAGWIALGAIFKVLLGLMILGHWTRGSTQIIGVLVGLDLLITGVSHLTVVRH
jgi:uncharacterized membrane protein HdeD (DUF308 family)